MKALAAALRTIEGTEDLLEKSLMLAGLVTQLFRKAGWDLVVVGGSAVEFYTEGAYMSGDIDVCRRSVRPIPLRTAQDMMGKLEATGGPRSWKVAGLFVDLLGPLENEARTPCRELQTPFGTISLVPPELVLVERALLAFYPRPEPEARAVAAKLLATYLTGETTVDWKEVDRLASLPSFRIFRELKTLKAQVLREIDHKA